MRKALADLDNQQLWMHVFLNSGDYSQFRSELTKLKTRDPLACLRTAQVHVKSGNDFLADETLNLFEQTFYAGADAGMKALYAAIRLYQEFRFSHLGRVASESMEEKVSAFPNEGLFAEAKFIVNYVYGIFKLNHFLIDSAKKHFDQLKMLEKQFCLTGSDLIDDLLDTISSLQGTSSIDELEKSLERKVKPFSINYLANISLLLQMKQRRGDYEYLYKTLQWIPASLLPPNAKKMVEIAARRTKSLGSLRINDNPDLAYLIALKGIVDSDAQSVLAASENMDFKRQSQRIIETITIGRAWALCQFERFTEAEKALLSINPLFVNYDTALFYHLTLLNMLMRSHFSDELKAFDFKKSVKIAIELLPFIKNGTVFYKTVGPGYANVIWMLACVSDIFLKYLNEFYTIVDHNKMLNFRGKRYTSEIYRNIFLRAENQHSKDAIMKAQKRFENLTGIELNLDNFVCIELELIQKCLPVFQDAYPERQSVFNEKFGQLKSELAPLIIT